MKMNKKLFILFILTTTFLVLIILIGLEIVLRLDFIRLNSNLGRFEKTHQVTEVDFFNVTDDLNTPYLPYPNKEKLFWWNASFKTNSFGYLGDFRNNFTKTQIIFLGDSVTFGIGVSYNDTFIEKLKSKINTDSYEIANLGIPGFNTLQEVQYFLKEYNAKRINPDIIVLQFGRNDFLSLKEIKQEENYSVYYDEKDANLLFPNFKPYVWLIEKSNLFFSVNQGLTKIIGGNYKKYPDRKRILESELHQFKGITDKQNIKVVFLMIPYKNKEWYPYDSSNLESIFPYTLNLENDLIKDNVWFDDLHPNADGHGLIANILYKYLLRNGLLH